MEYKEVTWYSDRVKCDMRIKVYGHYGIPVLVFPSLYHQSDEFYNYGVIDELEEFINNGKIKLFCLDSIDELTVASLSWDKARCAYLLNQYHEYVINEVLPFIYDSNKGYCEPIVLGCSMGATHAAINFFRRPELFGGVLALSGEYNLQPSFNGYMNDDVYNNSPIHFLSNMSKDHPWINEYNKKRMIFTCGTGDWEHLVLDSNYKLKDIFLSKGINAWFDILDTNNIHDWPSWRWQMKHYLPYFLK